MPPPAGWKDGWREVEMGNTMGFMRESWSIEIANNEDQYVTADWEFDVYSSFCGGSYSVNGLFPFWGGSTVTSGLI